MQAEVRVAIVQATPVMFNKSATVDKAIELAREAAAKGARVILFPESFIPCYPWYMNYGPKIGKSFLTDRKDFRRYFANAMSQGDEDAGRLSAAAAELGIYLVVGLTERAGNKLFCSTFFWGPDGAFLGKHRKLKPTGPERVIWCQGDGSELTAFETPYGTMGAVICWENYMPLLRAAMYAKGVSIYLAPTADSGEHWQHSIEHIALEGRCFVLSCNQYLPKSAVPSDLSDLSGLSDAPEILARGGSAIINPLGEYLAGPLYDQEGILTADLDLGMIFEARYDFDTVGHSARDDIFTLIVDERSPKGTEFIADEGQMQ